MATTQMRDMNKKKDTEETTCPKCMSANLLFIDGTLTRWATCPKCKFKKLIEKTDRGAIRVTPLMRPSSNMGD